MGQGFNGNTGPPRVDGLPSLVQSLCPHSPSPEFIKDQMALGLGLQA